MQTATNPSRSLHLALELVPAALFIALLLLGLAAATSAAFASSTNANADADGVSSALPVRVPVAQAESGNTTAWDINGDGRPDMIQVNDRGGSLTGVQVQTAYDFDGDGKPDFVRTNTNSSATESAP